MNTLSKKEKIAVFAGVVVLAYVFFYNDLIEIFGSDSSSTPTQIQIQNQTRTMDTNNQLPITGFVAQDLIDGHGEEALAGDTIVANYVGMLPNGKVFDSSYDTNQPITFVLGAGSVIKGWDQGLVGMKEGGKRILKIAPDFGYGSRAVGPIPANSTLVFQVELLEVQKR